MQPVETDLFDFDPAIAHGLQAALLECLATTAAVEQGEATVMRARGKQGNEKTHGRNTVSGEVETSLTAWHDTPV
jgi:hypothetical protein